LQQTSLMLKGSRNTMRTTARAIVIENDNILVMERNKFGHKYIALIGGGLEPGEELVDCLRRELAEEASIEISNPRLIIIEDAGQVFGIQYIYLCDYKTGEPKLAPDSDEALISAAGQNLYQPKWLPVSQLADSNLQPIELKELVIDMLQNGFPDKPIELTIYS
jgi:8-oxo-dGTP diphosphatase